MKEKPSRFAAFPATAVYVVLSALAVVFALSLDTTLQGGIPVREELIPRGPEVVLEAAKLVVSLATLVLGGLGFLVLREGGDVRRLQRWEVGLLLAAITGAALSVYFVFALYHNMAALLDEGAFRAMARPIHRPLLASMAALCGSVFSLGLWFVARVEAARRTGG